MAVSPSAHWDMIRRSFAGWWDGAHFPVLKLSHEIVKEFERLNSARLGKETLSRLTPRRRVRAVKEAIEAHHAGITRCC